MGPMPASSAPPRRQPDWSERGSAAVDLGDLDAARLCFAEAARRDRGNARHRYRLAVVEEALGHCGAAAASLTEALRVDPAMADAARRLALLAARRDLPADAPLSAAGLRAALAHDTVDRELIAELALRHLAGAGPLYDALAKARAGGCLAAARSLCSERTAPLLRDDLLIEVLRTGAFRNPELERLLTALRRALMMDTPLRRLEDPALFEFVLALAQQCQINEHVWAVGAEEAGRLKALLEALSVATGSLLDGDPAAGRRFLLAALYLPYAELLGAQVGPQQAHRIRPRALREAVAARLAETADERERAARMPRLGGAIADATARLIAAQYEANPYPRWTSVGLIAPAAMRRALSRHFTAAETAFLDRPCEVLIAGCGTGQQAVQAALAYGPKARVLAIDLSAASLAYAARMAERFGARNVAFAQADLATLHRCGAEFAGRFDLIECTGVLHHLGDPLAAWGALLECLAADGRMFLGLYSAIARRSLAALRADPAYPGPGCSGDALRAFRQALLDRPADRVGGDLRLSRDFYTASNFRDLALNVSEHPLTLPEIAQFLDGNALSFRGFQLERGVFGLFREAFPGEAWPGSLQCWARFEEANPHTFNGMYNFWCARLRPGKTGSSP